MKGKTQNWPLTTTGSISSSVAKGNRPPCRRVQKWGRNRSTAYPAFLHDYRLSPFVAPFIEFHVPYIYVPQVFTRLHRGAQGCYQLY